ncbi:MAG: Ppx/GppA phosphatase family protein [Ghiorsea sp.]
MSGNLRAVLDIGSNTIRLLIADISLKPAKRVHYQHHIARLGEGLHQTGALSDAGQQRALTFFADVANVCRRFGIAANEIYAVATAAVREASNRQAFVANVQAQTHINITVISGEKEVELALRGARFALHYDTGQDMLLFDVGGGSTEFARVQHGKAVDSISVKLGVVRLKESLLHSNPPSIMDYQAMKDHALSFLTQVELFWGNTLPPKHLVGTAGTVTTLAAIAQDMQVYSPDDINNFTLTFDSFCQLRDHLLSLTNAERLRIPALEKGREDVIIAGLAIIETIFERWEYSSLIAVDSGLLEGMLPTEQ